MRLLATGAFAWTKEEIQALEAMGHQVVFLQQEKDPLPCAPEWVEGAVCNGLFLSHPIEQFSNLRYIQLTSVGFDRVNMAYVTARGITIYNARGVYSVPMAEFAVGSVLAFYKQQRFFQENQKAHRWQKHRNLQELAGKRVCILGCGSVGTECARRFDAFGCHVTGVDVVPYEAQWYEKMVSLDLLDAVLAQSDVAVLTLPLTEDTRHLLDAKRLALLKNGAVLVNIARGGVVDQQALTEELAAKRIFAALDVLEEEPLPENSPLWELENVILTPHNSFVGDGNHQRMLDVILKNLNGV